MNRAFLTQGPVRAAAAGSALWVLACVAFAGWNALRDPMDARMRDLDSRLNAVAFAPEELPQIEDAPMQALRAVITKKETLWRPLIAPPPPPPPVEEKPDLLEKLKGVSASLRHQIRSGDSLIIKIHQGPEDTRGRWVGVGGKVNGLTIIEIKPDVVVFSLEQNGKQYTAELPRR